MLQYKDGRFYAPGVSLQIPNGFYLETEPEVYFEYGLTAWTPDRAYLVSWEFEEGCQGTEKELRDLFTGVSGIMLIGTIEPISVNGLNGHYAAYWGKNRKHPCGIPAGCERDGRNLAAGTVLWQNRVAGFGGS